MIKVFPDIFIISGELPDFHIMMPVVPTEGSVLKIPYGAVPDLWMQRIRKECKTKLEKEALARFEKELVTKGPYTEVEFEVLDSPPEWRMDHQAGNYVVDINVWPLIWDHNGNH